jgi:hypothetical protein
MAKIVGAPGDEKAIAGAAAFDKKAVVSLSKQCTTRKVSGACRWVAELYQTGTRVPKDEVKAKEFREHACQIDTKAPCPPPHEPAPDVFTKPETKRKTKQADAP